MKWGPWSHLDGSLLTDNGVRPQRDILGHPQYDLHCLVDGLLDVVQAGAQHDGGDGQDDVGGEERDLGFLVLLGTVGVLVGGGLEATLDGVQRQTGA